MAAERLPDLDAASFELLRLERRERDVLRQLEQVADRNEQFPNPVTSRRAEQLRREHKELVDRMLQLRALLLPRV